MGAFAATLRGRVARHLLNLESVVLVSRLHASQASLSLVQRIGLAVPLQKLAVFARQLYFGALFGRLGANLLRQILKGLLRRLLLQILLLEQHHLLLLVVSQHGGILRLGALTRVRQNALRLLVGVLRSSDATVCVGVFV